MKVRDLMTKNVRCCGADDPVTEAARIMNDLNVGIVPIAEGDKVVGMLTDRDIVIRGVAKGKDVTKTPCSEWMTRDAIACSPETDAHQAADMMAERQIRRLLVLDENSRLVGIVAIGDLATINIYADEAGDALSQISEDAVPGDH